MKKISKLSAVLLATGMAITPVQAENWPEKPIKITSPWKVGAGASNYATRLLQKIVANSQLSKQPITIFNHSDPLPVTIEKFAKYKPDGYNFMVMHTAIMTLEATDNIYLSYKDFQPVVRLGQFCEFSAVSKKSGINSLEELLAKGKAEPNTLVHGANLGAINHAFGLLVERLNSGTKFRFVQTGGDAATHPELAINRVQVGGFSASAAKKFTLDANGKVDKNSPVKLLAYAGSERHPKLPHVPTFRELGYDFEFCVDMWYFAPKGTPRHAINGFANLVKKALAEKEMQQSLSDNALVGKYLAGQTLYDDLERQRRVIFSVLKK